MPGLTDQHRSEGADDPRGERGCSSSMIFSTPLASAPRRLQLAGFEVAIAPDGFEALRVASEFQPSIMLLDIGLPDIDGFEVARRLRADAKFKAMVLIAFTAYASEESRSRAHAAGFDHYVVKPIPFAELLSLLVAGRPGACAPRGPSSIITEA